MVIDCKMISFNLMMSKLILNGQLAPLNARMRSVRLLVPDITSAIAGFMTVTLMPLSI
jgi:hypothetical protein